MQIRVSGLRGRRDDDGRPWSARVLALPAALLRRVAGHLREVLVHVVAEDGGAAEPAACRVSVLRRHGPPVFAAARGPDPESAARLALSRAARLLRREDGRRRASRSRRAA